MAPRGHQPEVKRWLTCAVVGLGLATWACGRSSKNPAQSLNMAEGGCANTCADGGGGLMGDAAGMPDTVAGTSSLGGAFVSLAGSTGSAGAAGAPLTTAGRCDPVSRSCLGRNIYLCNEAGTERELNESCGPEQHCEQLDGGAASCVPDVCAPGALRCIGNQIRTCNEGAFAEPGVDCGEMVCEGSSCQPKLCWPGANLCLEGDVYSCLGMGAKAELKKTCLPGTGCGEVPGTVACVVLACEPDSVACVADQIGTCANDGGALSSVDHDCAEQGKVCDAALACSAVAVDELGGSAHSTLAGDIFNVIDVRSSRHLAKLELGISPQDGDTNVHWQIYRQLYDGPDGFAEVLAEADSVLQAGETTAVTSELSYDLEAGQRYYIGARVDAVGGAIAAYEVLGEPQLLSFGLIDVPNSVAFVFAMRVTTQLP